MSFHHDEMLTISASVDSVRHIEGVVKMAAGEVRPVLFKKKRVGRSATIQRLFAIEGGIIT